MPKAPKASRNKATSFLSAKQLALLMGLSSQTIRNWIIKGDISAHRIDRNVNIPVDEALRLLKRYGLPVPKWLK
jgi:excisionase family DNA binding protein